MSTNSTSSTARIMTAPAGAMDLERFVGHSEGTWEVNATPHSSNQNFVVLDGRKPHSKRVCAIYSANEEADARLIAAAPSLLAECKRLRDENERLREALLACVVKLDADERDVKECEQARALLSAESQSTKE